MVSSPKQLGVIFLDRQKLDFYGSNITANLIRLDFPPNIIKDLEIVKRNELNILIKAFIEFHKITPSHLILVLSENICFEKNLEPAQEELLLPEVQIFLGTIPFENIASRMFQLKSKTKIIATNRDLYEGVKNAFENQGFTVKIAIPDFVLRKSNDLKESIDIETCRLIISKFDSYKQNSLINHQDILSPKKDQQDKSSLKRKVSLTLLTLLLVFLSLLSILVFMGVKTFTTKSTTLKQPLITPTIRIVVSPSTTLPHGLPQMENISIQIVNGSGDKEQEESVKEQLVKVGFRNILIKQAGNITMPKTLLVFSHDLPNTIREAVTRELNKMFGEISTQETTNLPFDIIITLGKKL